MKSGHSLESRDYWLDNSQDINTLEARALLNSLLSFRHHVTSSRVDVHTDSLVLKSALDNGGCKSSEVNSVLKDIFHCCREFNFSLDVHYVPSSKIQPMYLLGACRTQIVCCQRALGSRSSASSDSTPSTSCLRIVTVNVTERAGVCLASHLAQPEF